MLPVRREDDKAETRKLEICNVTPATSSLKRRRFFYCHRTRGPGRRVPAFHEQDTLAGRGLNLYCLISPVSFSCGNLVPWAFKMDGNVKLLGSKSRGGNCVVFPMTTAWGTSFAVSGPLRISFMINGAYYDVDRGVEPDYVIRTYDHLYDREALTNYINSLY